MLDELYDDVLSVMKEQGFVDWFIKNHNDKISPLKWCYDTNCERKVPQSPPKEIKWLINSYDDLVCFPYPLIIDEFGVVSPHHR